jgi:hypothetical protein
LFLFAGPPEPPQNCFLNTSSPEGLEVSCEAGFDGGLEQLFQLEILSPGKQPTLTVKKKS